MNNNQNNNPNEKKLEEITSNEKKQEEVIVGNIKEKKESKPIFVIFFFAILIVLVLFLPNITAFVNSVLNKNENVVLSNNNTNNQQNVQPETEKIVYYPFQTDTSFEVDNFVFTNFSKMFTDKYYATFDVQNKATSSKKLQGSKLFMEFYSSGQTLLERIMINDSDSLSSDETKSLNFQISENTYNNVQLVMVKIITEDEYPSVLVQQNENGEQELKCSNDENIVTYRFIEQQLATIVDNYTYTNSDITTYSEKVTQYKSISKTDNETAGFSSTVTEGGNNTFAYSLEINLKLAKKSSLTKDYYYPLNTEAKVINFELESSNFNCN